MTNKEINYSGAEVLDFAGKVATGLLGVASGLQLAGSAASYAKKKLKEKFKKKAEAKSFLRTKNK